MKEIFLFILFLFPFSINSYIGNRAVDMDISPPTNLYVSIKNDTYFYVKSPNLIQDIYTFILQIIPTVSNRLIIA